MKTKSVNKFRDLVHPSPTSPSPETAIIDSFRWQFMYTGGVLISKGAIDPGHLRVLHVGIAVIVNQEGQFLLQRRSEPVELAGVWEFPGGKMKTSEKNAPWVTACREAREERGISVKSSADRYITSHIGLYTKTHIVAAHLFACAAVSRIGVSTALAMTYGGDKNAWDWFTVEEALKLRCIHADYGRIFETYRQHHTIGIDREGTRKWPTR